MALTEEQRAAIKAKAKQKSNTKIVDHTPENIVEPPDMEEIDIREYDADKSTISTEEQKEEALTKIVDENFGLESDFSGVAGPTSIVPFDDIQLVKGMELNPDWTEDQKVDFLENIYSYIGAIPRPAGDYINTWLTVIGVVLMPVEADKEVTNTVTGEVENLHLKWDIPLIKIDEIDKRTGENVIIGGGGHYGRQFAQVTTKMFGVGDWKSPQRLLISSEERRGADGSPRRMFRFNFKRLNREKKNAN